MQVVAEHAARAGSLEKAGFAAPAVRIDQALVPRRGRRERGRRVRRWIVQDGRLIDGPVDRARFDPDDGSVIDW